MRAGGAAGERPDLHVNNGTTLPATIVLDGTALGVVGANASKDFAGANLPELPWRVEAKITVWARPDHDGCGTRSGP